MAHIYDKILQFIDKNTLELKEVEKPKKIETYLETMENNMLSNILLLIKNNKLNKYKCKADTENTILIDDSNEILINNLIKIDNDYYFITKCVEFDQMSYRKMHLYPTLKINKKNKNIIIEIIGFIGDVLHQLSSIMLIRNKMTTYVNILNSFIDPNLYAMGDYSNNNIQINKCNKEQYNIINNLKYNLEFIQGPPGTGKTTTMINIMKKVIPEKHRILLTSVQNQTIDTIVLKLTTDEHFKGQFVVIGNENNLKNTSQKYTINNILKNDDIIKKNNKKILKYNDVIELINNNMYDKKFYEMKKKEQNSYISDVKNKIQKKETLNETRKSEIIGNFKYFISTIDSSHMIYNMSKYKINTIIVDEAAATSEMQLFPLIRLDPTNIIFIGDHKQLSSFTLLQDTTNIFYNKSLMERMITNNRKNHILVRQYRMHSNICNLVSSLFYDNLLYSDESRKTKIKNNVEWIDTKYDDEQVGTSFKNTGELDVIKQICNIYSKHEVLILTFYIEQLNMLKKQFKMMQNITCRTINTCQGMESDVVIVSLVKSQHCSKFVCDPKKICVLLSRAMNKLIIVGNSEPYCKNEIWKKIYDHINENII